MSETIKNIIDNILDNNYVAAENDIHGILNSKIYDAFEEIQTSMGSEFADNVDEYEEPADNVDEYEEPADNVDEYEEPEEFE